LVENRFVVEEYNLTTKNCSYQHWHFTEPKSLSASNVLGWIWQFCQQGLNAQ